MSLEQNAADKLQAILDEHGVLSVLTYFIENASTVLGAANTGLVRGALNAAHRLIRDHGEPNVVLQTLLGTLADGLVFARPALDASTLDPGPRLSISGNLGDATWRVQSAADVARKAAGRG